MTEPPEITLPEGFDWRRWIDRWERMQERYLLRRAERFDLIARLVEAARPKAASIVDLGCGPASLTEHLLGALPDAMVVGLDCDPTMLCLARPRLAPFGRRAAVFHADLRRQSWKGLISAPVDAVVSATSLHWLQPRCLEKLYHSIAAVLRPGGIFLNADHVASDSPAVQKTWEDNRAAMREREAPPDADDWDGFFQRYGAALGVDMEKLRGAAIGDWEGVEEGLPLAWHFDKLRSAGFARVDCFWRLDCDAIYGGIKCP